MNCNVVSNEGQIVPSSIMQTDINSFSISIKCDQAKNSEDFNLCPPPRTEANLTTNSTTRAELNQYSLRNKRKRDESTSHLPSSKKTKTLVRREPKSKLKPIPCEQVGIGEIVLCKMKNWCEWPAVVTRIDGNLISIRFFGDGSTQKMSIIHFFKFVESNEVIKQNLLNRKTPLYAKAIKEAERALKVPDHPWA